MAKKRTSAPKTAGLTVARNKNNIILTWTPIKDCTDQDIRVLLNNKVVVKKDLGKTSRKYTYTIKRADWYPNLDKKGNEKPKLTEVAFKLSRTQKKKKQSKFSDQKEFKINPPQKPKYIQPFMDSTHHDRFSYSWERNEKDGDINTSKYMFTRFKWETCLVDNGQEANWELVNSQKITTVDTISGIIETDQSSYGTKTMDDILSVIIVEKQEDINARKKRYFHVQAIGPAGPSDFQTMSHQLGGSDAIEIEDTATEYLGSDDTGTSGSVNIDIPKVNPNDTIQVEYAVTNPYVVQTVDSENDISKSKLILPDDFTGWSIGDTFTGAGVPDKYTFKYPVRILDNTALFLRINRIHDNITSLGTPFIMDQYESEVTGRSTQVWPLSSPVLLSLNAKEGSKEVTVTVRNTAELAEGGNHSFIAVYQRIGNDSENVIGIIPYLQGEDTATFKGDWKDTENPSFGIRCFVANYTPTQRKSSGVTIYQISNILMQSSGIIWKDDAVSKPPGNVKVSRYNSTTALVEWDWTWDEADSAEISWSDNKIAWDSIDDPPTYVLSNTRRGFRYVTGLSPTTYYFRVRFIKSEGEYVTYGKYSEDKEILMASAPSIPTLTLSDEDGVVAADDEVTAYWGYESTDGTPQGKAIIGEVARDNETPTPLQDAIVPNSSTKYAFKPSQFGWTEGQHYISVKVTSGSGQDSNGWSNPVGINIAPKPVIHITGIGGADDAIKSVSDDEEGYIYALTRMPIVFSVSGSGRRGFCSVVIERASDFDIERPDDTTIVGFSGETITSMVFRPPESTTDDTIPVLINVDDLMGQLDNTAQYLMTVSITDEYGQTDSVEYPFTVAWDYFATMPSADIIIDFDNDRALITPYPGGEIEDGDYCRIYRLSADKPQLVLDYGIFGEQYEDIYPTFGRFGGYRIVHVSRYGDYKTEDNLIAMTEYSKVGNDEDIDQYDQFVVSINFDGNVVEFPGNISLSASWAKDFQTTKYLGGSIQGDWNPGVQRTGSINGTVPVEYEAETVYGLRLLADYSGICHVRTPEGSNFYADVQVKDDREEKWVNKISKISLSYTKVDGEEEELQIVSTE